MTEDKVIQLGLEEVIRATDPQLKTPPESQSSVTSDPLKALAQAGSYRALLNAVEPVVETLPADKISVEKVWWIVASVKLDTPEQFLLGSITDVPAGSVERNSALGELVRDSLVQLHAAGAVLLASELTRILDSGVKAPSEKPKNFDTSDSSPTPVLTAKSRQPLNTRPLIAALGLMLCLGGIYYFWRLDSHAGQVAQATLVTNHEPPLTSLAPPALAPVSAPSALDKVLVALDNRKGAKSSAESGGRSVTDNPTREVAPVSRSESQRSLTAINWDEPVEPEEVRRLIEEGDPVDSREDDTARRLFGDRPRAPAADRTPHSPFEARGSQAGDGSSEGALGRLVEYRVLAPTIASREAKFTSPKITTFQPGDIVFVDLIDGPFCRIRMASGGVGYILSQDLEEVKD